MNQINRKHARMQNRSNIRVNERNTDLESNCWGSPFSENAPSSNLRIVGLNIGGLNPKKDGVKNQAIRNLMTANSVDILCLTELGISWNNIEEEHKPDQMIQGWFNQQAVKYAYLFSLAVTTGPHTTIWRSRHYLSRRNC